VITRPGTGQHPTSGVPITGNLGDPASKQRHVRMALGACNYH